MNRTHSINISIKAFSFNKVNKFEHGFPDSPATGLSADIN